MRLVTDIDLSFTLRMFEVLYEESDIFEHFSKDEAMAMAAIFKVMQFKK